MYLVIHNNHVSTEEVVVCNDASEPLGGWILSIHTYTVAIQWIGTWKQQDNISSQCYAPTVKVYNLMQVPIMERYTTYSNDMTDNMVNI